MIGNDRSVISNDVLRVHTRRFLLKFPMSQPPEDGVLRPFAPVSYEGCANTAGEY